MNINDKFDNSNENNSVKKIVINKNFIIILLIAFLIFVTGNSYYEKNILTNKIKQQNNIISTNTEYLNNINKYVILLPNDKSKLFHKVGCEHFSYKASYIMIKQTALSVGYSPCNLCF